MRPQDPFKVYRGNETATVHAVDFPAWAALGWTQEPPEPQPEPEPKPVIIVPHYAERKAELEALYAQSWQKIQQIAAKHGITQKPAGGWDEAIVLILKAEGLAE